jgi:hypothetical protein
MPNELRSILFATLLAVILAAPASALGPDEAGVYASYIGRHSDTPFDHSGPYMPPILDFILLRPPAVIATAGGLAVWLVCAPFNLLGGVDHLVQSGKTLVVAPARYAFVDRLGSH